MFQSLWILTMLSCGMGRERINQNPTLNVQLVADYSNRGLKKSYKSSVKIVVIKQEEILGNGSGNYFSYKGKNFIITSAHVVEEVDHIIAEGRLGIESVACEIIYINNESDIAILVPRKDLQSIEPVKYTWSNKVKRGEIVYFTNNPSGLSDVSFHGTVAGSTAEYYIIQSAAWMGSSGSVAFNKKGQAIGVLAGVKVGYSPLGFVQVINNIVMVSPIFFLNTELLEKILNL